MRFLPEAPDELADVLLSQVRGIMQPKAMQDVLEAVAKVKMTGVPAMVSFCARQLGLLPAYHVVQAVRLYANWHLATKLELGMQTDAGMVPFGNGHCSSPISRRKTSTSCREVSVSRRKQLSDSFSPQRAPTPRMRGGSSMLATRSRRWIARSCSI